MLAPPKIFLVILILFVVVALVEYGIHLWVAYEDVVSH